VGIGALRRYPGRRGQPRRRAAGGRQSLAVQRRRHPGAVRGLAGAARPEDAAAADRAPVGQRAGHRRAPGGPFPGDRSALPRRRHNDIGDGQAADARRVRPAALVRGHAGQRGCRGQGGGEIPADPAGDQLRRGRVDLGTARPVAGRDRAARPDPAIGRRGARRGPDRRHRPSPGGTVMPAFSVPGAAGSYELDDNPARIDPAAAAAFLTTEAYWGRWRAEPDIRRQIAAAWRVIGAYDAAGAMVGFARAISDGGSAYLADVYVMPAHRGRGLGKAVVAMMVEEGPGAGFRWMLHTSDAYGLYRQFGFEPPPDNYMERPQRLNGARIATTDRHAVADAGPLTGDHVRLEPLGVSHVPGLLKAAAQ